MQRRCKEIARRMQENMSSLYTLAFFQVNLKSKDMIKTLKTNLSLPALAKALILLHFRHFLGQYAQGISRRCEFRSTSRRCRFPYVRIGTHRFLRLHLSPSLPKHVKTLDSLAASNGNHPNNCSCIFPCLHHL